MNLFRFFLIPILLFITFFCKGQSLDSADYYFKSANNRLKTNWEHLDSSEFVQAVEEYQKALVIKPSYWQAFRNRSRVFVYLKQYDSAFQDLNAAIAVAEKPALPALHELRGMLLYKKGFYKESIEDFDFTVHHHHHGKEAEMALLYRAKAKWKLGNKKEACKDYKNAIKLNKNLEKERDCLRCD